MENWWQSESSFDSCIFTSFFLFGFCSFLFYVSHSVNWANGISFVVSFFSHTLSLTLIHFIPFSPSASLSVDRFECLSILDFNSYSHIPNCNYKIWHAISTSRVIAKFENCYRTGKIICVTFQCGHISISRLYGMHMYV